MNVTRFSSLSEFNIEYTAYRLEVLEERIRHMLKKEQKREVANCLIDIADGKGFLLEQMLFLDSMINELIEVD